MLNIKNPRAHALAVEVAQATGETLTDAVIHALEERRARVKPQPQGLDMQKIEDLLTRIRARLPQTFIDDPDPTTSLYDPDTGLPA